MNLPIDTDPSFHVESLLLELRELQSKGDSFYLKGLFPSQRYHPFLPYKREDDNLFFTASIVHILQGVRSQMTNTELKVADSIIADGLSSYSLFKNKDGLDTYNFWQTKPSRHFPNGLLMHRLKHFQIPDDVDDTSLVFLTENASKERVEQLREKLKQHSNLAYKQAFNPLPIHRDLRCYSTFFGKKMYIEFDICVLSNLMRLILMHFKDELNEFDHDTLRFITEAIANDEHKEYPFRSAPNYPTTELILYHVSRLIPLLPEEYSITIREKIESELFIQVRWAKGMKRILLENAMLKLGVELPSISTSGMTLETGLSMEPMYMTVNELMQDSSFFFFHAGMITAFENKIAQSLAHNSFFHLRYASKALNGALLVENILLKRITPA